MKINKLIKEIKRQKDKSNKKIDKILFDGEWHPISEFSELEGQVDALTNVLEYYDEEEEVKK